MDYVRGVDSLRVVKGVMVDWVCCIGSRMRRTVHKLHNQVSYRLTVD